jgi:hypothetical protein
MTEFVNLDAKWLHELAQAFDGEAEQARLLLIAERLEKLDEQVRNLQSSSNQIGEFERGVQAERLRIFGRSNLPPQSVEVSPELHAALLASKPVKKIARGVSAFAPLPAPKKLKEVKKLSSPALNEILSGLKIDLSSIGRNK